MTARSGDVYEIRVRGQLDPCWAHWFEPMSVSHLDWGETVLRGPVLDASALHGLLTRLHDLGMTLIAVQRLGDPV